MGTRTITIKECDRCGNEIASIDAGANEWGETTIKYQGHTGGRTYDGSAGGVNHKGEALLCLKCTRGFLAFMARTEPKSGNG
ncbi:hypothetical protein [Cupriavidus pauculus]|uniref:hypothetical protein n=1 Tax=Cupriavidus pauculus TaxID=82633 RepID=UPI00078312EC|nr:hypothetical protein [Cupriavidus pauculus]